ncbi:MAG: hypothetical protein JXQ75_18165 [Phycisphaerae bacterium]|nr:hypothetical protein [Phycisphaerae bacterium]
MKTTLQHPYRIAMMCCAVASLGLVGCQAGAVQVSLDSAAQSLVEFVGDFAWQVLAAYLF